MHRLGQAEPARGENAILGRDKALIQLILPARAARGWHLRLAMALADDGHGLTVTWAEDAAPPLAGLELLRFVESRLYARRAIAGVDPCALLAPSAFVALPRAEGPVDVVLDCSGLDRAPVGDAPVLQPCYDGSSNENALIAALVESRPPTVGWRRQRDGRMIAGGPAAITSPHVLTQGFSDALVRLISLAVKSLRLICQPADDQVLPVLRPAPAAASLASLSGFALASLAGGIQRRLSAALAKNLSWMVGWRASTFGQSLIGSGRLPAGDFRWAPDVPGRFLADPFPFEHQGRRYIFVEELPYATGRGFISVIELDEALAPVSVRPVLEEPVHMSYPCVFRYGDHVWMIPETVARRRIELYRADPFPDRWVLHRVLIENIHAADATLFAHDGLLWLSAATGDHGATDRDAMSLYHAEHLEGPWTPHPLNPVVVDVHGARPAGWIVKANDGLRRPAQDCSAGYGSGLSVRRIDRLTREDYVETELARIAPPALWKATGFHTVNWAAGIEAIDAVR